MDETKDLPAVLAFIRAEIQKLSNDLGAKIARDQSPWMSAKSAAEYADCSPAAIFKAANMGIITRHDTFSGPRFSREEIDKAIVKAPSKVIIHKRSN